MPYFNAINDLLRFNITRSHPGLSVLEDSRFVEYAFGNKSVWVTFNTTTQKLYTVTVKNSEGDNLSTTYAKWIDPHVVEIIDRFIRDPNADLEVEHDDVPYTQEFDDFLKIVIEFLELENSEKVGLDLDPDVLEKLAVLSIRDNLTIPQLIRNILTVEMKKETAGVTIVE